ncbi:hypothetical protein WS68_08210 [Burkholderia sp. TSV86]|nr:hypothetical protein WS68_08210 [Burkholderia sp. TSV86]
MLLACRGDAPRDAALALRYAKIVPACAAAVQPGRAARGAARSGRDGGAPAPDAIAPLWNSRPARVVQRWHSVARNRATWRRRCRAALRHGNCVIASIVSFSATQREAQ